MLYLFFGKPRELGDRGYPMPGKPQPLYVSPHAAELRSGTYVATGQAGGNARAVVRVHHPIGKPTREGADHRQVLAPEPLATDACRLESPMQPVFHRPITWNHMPEQ